MSGKKAEAIMIGDIEMLTTADAARISGLAREYMAGLAQSGRIHAVMIGGNWYIHPDDLDQFIKLREERLAKAADEPLRILQFIADYNRDIGIAPTTREIMMGVGASSTSIVTYHISNLVEMGYLNKIPSAARAIVITKGGREELRRREERQHAER